MAKMTNNPVRLQYIRHNFSEISYKNLRFLITDRPTDANMEQYITELKKANCKVVVRVCEPTYSTEKLAENGITVLDWQFPDGHGPPAQIVENWFSLLLKVFYGRGQQIVPTTVPHTNNNNNVQQLSAVRTQSSATSSESSPVSSAQGGRENADANLRVGSQSDPPGRSSSPQLGSPCVAVHCVAGLGRAPVLVAIALMERGIKYEDAVDLIRTRRQGALNMKQLEYLRQYKKSKRLPRVGYSGSGSGSIAHRSNGVGGPEGDKQCIIL